MNTKELLQSYYDYSIVEELPRIVTSFQCGSSSSSSCFQTTFLIFLVFVGEVCEKTVLPSTVLDYKIQIWQLCLMLVPTS